MLGVSTRFSIEVSYCNLKKLETRVEFLPKKEDLRLLDYWGNRGNFPVKIWIVSICATSPPHTHTRTHTRTLCTVLLLASNVASTSISQNS